MREVERSRQHSGHAIGRRVDPNCLRHGQRIAAQQPRPGTVGHPQGRLIAGLLMLPYERLTKKWLDSECVAPRQSPAQITQPRRDRGDRFESPKCAAGTRLSTPPSRHASLQASSSRVRRVGPFWWIQSPPAGSSRGRAFRHVAMVWLSRAMLPRRRLQLQESR